MNKGSFTNLTDWATVLDKLYKGKFYSAPDMEEFSINVYLKENDRLVAVWDLGTNEGYITGVIV